MSVPEGARVTLRGMIELGIGEATPLTLETLELVAEGELAGAAGLMLRLEGPLHEVWRLTGRLPELAELFPPMDGQPADARGLVELVAPGPLLALLRAARLPPEAALDAKALLAHAEWCSLAFDVGRYEPRAVGVRTSRVLARG